MILLYGKRSIRIKKYTDNTHACPSCRAFDLDVSVYKSYYHLFFIPFFPSWEKYASITCNACEYHFSDQAIEKEYEDKSKSPVYLYTGPILIALLILFMINANLRSQKRKADYVAQPQTGDIYRIRDDKGSATSYYFLRIVRISGDSVFIQHNHLIYTGFVVSMRKEDYFEEEEELIYTKADIKKMLEEGAINDVER
jgi:hypothetical protein